MSCIAPSRAGIVSVASSLLRRSLAGIFALTLLVGLAPVASAADAATGTIKGRVMNAQNGTYLNNARVSIAGANRTTLTNEYGEYTLENVPAGDVTVQATFTGQQPVTATVTVAAGVAATHDFEFNADGAKRDANGTVLLDPFVVEANRFKNAAEIAIQEERTSINIKNVVSTDMFGNIPSNNVGEFVKFLPGVQVAYGSFGGNNQGYADSDASQISVRGFGPEDTAILVDGLPISNATPGSLTRTVALDQLSINNASRIELIKVATPDMPSNSPGGQINLITKSAFEYARPTYSARVYFNFNSLNTDMRKSPGPVNKSTYKTTPALDVTVTYPFSKKFGLSFTGSAANEFDQTYRAQPSWTTTGTTANAAGQVVSLSNPILSRLQITDSPRLAYRRSANLHADWRPTPGQVIRANAQYSTYDSVEAQRRLDIRPAIAAGADWGPTYTTGTTGNGTTDMTVTTLDRVGVTRQGQIQYSLNHGGWRIDAAASRSVSTGSFRDKEHGHFSEVNFKLNPGKVAFSNIYDGIPGQIDTYKRSNGPLVAYTNFLNYGFDNQIAKRGQSSSESTVSLYKIDLSRDLDFIRFLGSNSFKFQTGFRRDVEKTVKSGTGTGYADVLDTGKTYAIADVLDTDYMDIHPGYGLPAQQWGSSYKLYQLDQQNQLFIVPVDGTTQAVSNYNSYVGQNKKLTETTDAGYAMLSGSLLKNRVSFVGGVRYEKKKREGFGPSTDSKWNFAKLPSGRLYTDSIYTQGVRYDIGSLLVNGSTVSNFNFLTDTALIARMKAAGVTVFDHNLASPTTSLESRKLQLRALYPIYAQTTPPPSYSLSTSIEVTKKIQLKLGWSRALQLPNLEDAQNGILSGNGAFTINENIPEASDGTKGEIKVANPNIQPQLSNNLDAELVYYTDNGGKISVSHYWKTVTNQIVNFGFLSDTAVFAEVLPALGLDPADYQNWKLTTSTNDTHKQKTSGWEIMVQQDFGFLGRVGKQFSGFVSYSWKELGDPPTLAPVPFTSPNGTVGSLTAAYGRTIKLSSNRFGGGGLQFAGRHLTVQVRGTYKNRNEKTRTSLSTGNYFRTFEPSETRIDLNANWKINKTYSVFLSGRDVFNAERRVIQRDDFGLLPAYAFTNDLKTFGVSWTVGVNGNW